MAYDGQTIVDIDVTRPDGDAEPKSILDDVDKEIKRALKNTPYCWTRLQNLTGSSLVAGDVVAIGGVDGLILGDTVGSFLKYVVVVEPIAVAAVGLVAREGGPVDALVAGPVTAYNYIRKSASTKAFEDMGIAAVPGLLTPNGAVGFAVRSTTGAGLCSIFLFEHTVAAPTEVSNHVLNLINRTGVVVAVGAVGSPDPANDNSVVLNDVKGTLRPVVVAFESMPNITMGKWVNDGVHPVLAQGPITRMHYLRKSATSMVLESTGVGATNVAQRPPGTVGIALAEFPGSGTGLVQTMLFGATADVSTMSLPKVTGLVGSTVNPSVRSYGAYRACLFNPLDGSTITISSLGSYTNNLAISGRGGRDQANTFNPNIDIYFYLTWDGSTIATRSSTKPPSVGPTLAGGESHFAFLDVMHLDGTSSLQVVTTRDDWSAYLTPSALAVYSTLNGAVVNVIPTSSVVPATAHEFEINVFGQAEVVGPDAGGFVDFEIWVGGNSAYRIARLGLTGVSDGNTKRDGLQMGGRIPNTGFFACYWRPTQGNVSVVVAVIQVIAYKNPV